MKTTRFLFTAICLATAATMFFACSSDSPSGPSDDKREKISVKQLAGNIRHYVEKYDDGGSESKFGKKSHSAFINALKRFEEFVNSKSKTGEIYGKNRF
jgi:hypothetical protein